MVETGAICYRTIYIYAFLVPQVTEFYAKTRYYAQMLTINVCNRHFITLIQVTKVKSLRIQNGRKRCYLPSGSFKDFVLG